MTCCVACRPQIAMDMMLQPTSEHHGIVVEHFSPPRLTFRLPSRMMAEIQTRLIDSCGSSHIDQHTAHLRLLAPNVNEHVMDTIAAFMSAVVTAQPNVGELTPEARAAWQQWCVRLIRGCQGTIVSVLDRIFVFLSVVCSLLEDIGDGKCGLVHVLMCMMELCAIPLTRRHCTVASPGPALQIW
jgi:hypothetical protein